MTRVLLLAAVLALGLAGPADAAKLTVRGAPAPGPDRYDRLDVWTYGPATAKTVFVLVPGTSGGAGSVAPVARDIAERVPGLQVWAMDRREQAFEDHSAFRAGDLEAARAYYLNFRFKRPSNPAFVAGWGLAVQTEDLRRVVARARAGGRRKVILGGHSRGASQAAAYAAWDFKGRPGYRDLAGLVLIDGGLQGFIDKRLVQPYTRRSALAAVRRARSQPFHDSLGQGVPAAGPIFGQLAGTYAAARPDEASVLQNEAVVPEYLRRDIALTNEAFLGTVFDHTYSPPTFGALRIHAGALADAGDPRPWVSGELTPIERFATAWAGLAPDFAEWYYPERLVVDIGAANPMRRDAASSALGLRLWHTRRITTPLYAFETDLAGGRVLDAARRLATRSRIRRTELVSDPASSHLDPVLAAPEGNRFLQTVVPFLSDLV